MSIAAAILIGISPFIGSVFTREDETVRLVMFYLIFAALSEPGLGISQAYYGAFRGMGSTYLPLLISIFSVLMLRASACTDIIIILWSCGSVVHSDN